MYLKRKLGHFCYLKEVNSNKIHHGLLTLLLTMTKFFTAAKIHISVVFPGVGRWEGFQYHAHLGFAVTSSVQ